MNQSQESQESILGSYVKKSGPISVTRKFGSRVFIYTQNSRTKWESMERRR